MTIRYPALPAFTLSLSRPTSGDVSDATNTVLLFFMDEAHLLAGTRLFSLVRGDAVVLPPETPAYLYPEGTGGRVLRLLLPTAPLRTLAPHVLLTSATGGAVFTTEEGLSPSLADIETGDALSLFVLLSALTRARVVTETRECPLPRCVRVSLAALSEHGERLSDTKALALYSGVSESTLLRALRTHLLLTPKKYLRLVESAGKRSLP